MDSRTTARALKVVAFLLFGAALFSSLYFFLRHLKLNSYYVQVRFSDAKGLLRQSFVRMRGVNIGEVESIELDTDNRMAGGEFPRPVVTLKIDRKYSIPQDSEFRIISGLLISNPQVEIHPGRSPKLISQDKLQRFDGAESGGALEALSPELQQTVQKLNTTFDDVKGKLNDTTKKLNALLDDSRKLVQNSNRTIVALRDTAEKGDIQRELKTTLANLRVASDNGRQISVKLNKRTDELFTTGKEAFGEVKEKVVGIFDRLDNTLQDADDVVKKLTEQVADPRLQQSFQDTLELARTTLARFNQIASDLHQFAGDPQLQSDFKQTVANLKNATARGEEAIGKVNNLLGNVTGAEGKPRTLRLPKTELLANISQTFDPGRLRVDFEGRLRLSEGSMLNAGLFAIGQDTRLTLQGGSYLNRSTLARYGLYASRLGAGLEWMPSRGTGFRADLYDTDHPRLDLRALYRVNNTASLWIGADGIFQNTSPVIGIQLLR